MNKKTNNNCTSVVPEVELLRKMLAVAGKTTPDTSQKILTEPEQKPEACF